MQKSTGQSLRYTVFEYLVFRQFLIETLFIALVGFIELLVGYVFVFVVL